MKTNLLVVDDEPGVRSFLADCFENYNVVTAEDGVDAWAKLSKHSFHAVITDLKMPNMDGLSLLKKIKEEQPEVEVIMLSAHGDVSSAVEAMRLGAFDFAEKPIQSPAVIRALIIKAVEHRSIKNKLENQKSNHSIKLSWGAPAMQDIVKSVSKVAPTNATVLLYGESGTGKEVTAKAIHHQSHRSDGPFVAVNCAVLSDTLLESELFGHEKGAFTGADKRKRGKIELAEGGTFFLDEIGELKIELQAKLLRLLQEKVFERVGGNQKIQTDARFIAATNRKLETMVSEGTFREDLYHRLSVFPISLPPLRQRKEDISYLCQELLLDISRELGRNLALSSAAQLAIEQHTWPGNIRALRNALERAAIMSDNNEIDVSHLLLPKQIGESDAKQGTSMADIEKNAINNALKQNMGNRKNAAKELGIGERTLYEKIKKYGLN